jgi:hypothetical protein
MPLKLHRALKNIVSVNWLTTIPLAPALRRGVFVVPVAHRAIARAQPCWSRYDTTVARP